MDPKFELSADDTAKFIARLTDTPLITSEEEIEIDEKLVEVVGDAVIRRKGVFPHKQISPNTIAVLMSNPLDYAKRDSFQMATELTIKETRVASASFIEGLVKNSSNRKPKPRPMSILVKWLR